VVVVGPPERSDRRQRKILLGDDERPLELLLTAQAETTEKQEKVVLPCALST
jgi:hypothetical protein